MSYDDVILHVGEIGRYQRRIFVILFLPAISFAFHKMGGLFLTAKADFRCLLPYENPENATYELPPNITNIIYLWNNETNTWPQCERYDLDLINQYHASSENISSVPPTVKCESFVYDKTDYTMTATTEWNLVCDETWFKTVSDSLFMLGDMPGGVIFGGLSDRYGRKTPLLWGAIMQLVCGLLVVVSPNFITYTILRVLVGTTTSGVFLIAYVAAVEMVGPRKRMTVGICANLTYAGGYILSAILAYFIRHWRILQIAFAIPTLAVLAFWWYIPESARWLLIQGRTQQAKDILHKASLENGVELSRDTIDALLENDGKRRPNLEKTSVFDLVKYPNLRRKTLLLFLMWFVNSITYYGLSWNTSNLGGNDYLNFAIAAAVEIPAYSFLLLTLDRWGRKIMLCGGMLFAGISLLLTFSVPTDMTWLLIFFTMIGKFAITCSWGTAYISTAEHYPTSMRNIGLAACSAVARIGGVFAPFINHLFEISTYLPLVMLGTSSLIAGLLSLLLPETLNEELPETIQDGEEFGKTTSKSERNIELSNRVDVVKLLNEIENEMCQKQNRLC